MCKPIAFFKHENSRIINLFDFIDDTTSLHVGISTFFLISDPPRRRISKKKVEMAIKFILEPVQTMGKFPAICEICDFFKTHNCLPGYLKWPSEEQSARISSKKFII